MKRSKPYKGRRNPVQCERTSDYRLEINIAFREIEHAFESCPHQPYRIARKWDGDQAFLELAFITPKVGERYHELMVDLEVWTLWELRIRKSANDHAITQAVRNSVPNGFRLTRSPRIQLESTAVHVQCDGPLSEVTGNAWKEKILEFTGLDLVIQPYPAAEGSPS